MSNRKNTIKLRLQGQITTNLKNFKQGVRQ